MEDIVDDESIVSPSVKVFSEGFDSKERNIWILPQIYYGIYSIGSPFARLAVTVHTTSGIQTLQEGPEGTPHRSTFSY